MENEKRGAQISSSFSLSSSLLKFTDSVNNLKITIKNLSLKTGTYELILSDQEHFKLANSSRTFSLAPGISKSITIKHVHGIFCQMSDRHILQARIRDYNGNASIFQCCCPKYKQKTEQVLIEYLNVIQLGQFDHKVHFEVEIKNVSNKNLKLLFNQIQTRTNSNISHKQIIFSTKNIKLKYKNDDTIMLAHEKIKLDFQLIMPNHGELKEKLQFKILTEDAAEQFMNKDEEIVENNIAVHSILLTGFSVSKKLVIKDENLKITSQINNQMLTGTSKTSFFYIETQYHENVEYNLQAYIQAQTPSQYAQKWSNVSIQFCDQNKNKFHNSLSGILKKNVNNKIQYKLITNYTIDDENYVSKYAKIKFEDDSNALRMRNSEHSKKYEDIQLKFVIKFPKDKKELKSVKKFQDHKASQQLETIVPFKCVLINPSLRCQVNQNYEACSQIINILISNQTKISIPYNFPTSSLYRIITNTNSSCKQNQIKLGQSPTQYLNANKKQVITVKWIKQKERCPIYMQIPSFDLVLYEPRERELKQRNMISLPPSRKRPQTSISSAIKVKQRQVTAPSQQIGCFHRDNTKRMNSQQIFHNRNINNISRPFTPIAPMKPQGYLYNQTKKDQGSLTPFLSATVKKIIILNELPKSYKGKSIYEFVPSIQDLKYLISYEKTLKNTHPQIPFIVQVIDKAYLILNPGQFYSFDGSMGYLTTNDNSTIIKSGFFSDIRYKIFGHDPIYILRISDINIQNVDPMSTQRKSNQKYFINTNKSNQATSKQLSPRAKSSCQLKSRLYQPPVYQILCREIKMSFKQSKQQFQIVQVIPIKNCSTQPIQINCISLDGQFFKSKEANGILTVHPQEIGKFKISFKPQNNIRLSILNREQPRQQRRKAIIKSSSLDENRENLTTVKRQIKLMINKNVQIIQCIGQIIQKSCSIKPQKIKFINCKYGSPEIVESMMITNTSPYKIKFIIENPNQISIKPKNGIIPPKSTQSCTVTFKPCKKISSFNDYIKIYIGGSHMQLVPIMINVEDPQIYIKQSQLIPEQYAICGTQTQQLCLQMSLINDNPSQSFVEINLTDTPLFIGYSKNYSSTNSGLVMQNFTRCSQIIEDQQHYDISSKHINSAENSMKSLLNQSQISQVSNYVPNNGVSIKNIAPPQRCTITVAPNSFLIVPLTLRIKQANMGTNIIHINKNIAALSGFGEIKSPKIIKFNCNKTLLHISPYKQLYRIVLTQNQKNYLINLRNLAGKTLRVKTTIRQIKQQIQNKGSQKSIANNEQIVNKSKSSTEPSIICTYKDICQYLPPQGNIDLNMSFICFEAEKKVVTAIYQLNVFVKQCQQNKQNALDALLTSMKHQLETEQPYFSTKINVIMPEPFLQLSPNILVMPTIGINTWSRQSFVIRNNGYNEIFIKIKKPININFDLECQIINVQHRVKSKQKNKNRSNHRISNISNRTARQGSQNKGMKPGQNLLTKINNTMEVRVSFRSKTKISFNVIIEIEDNLGNVYEMPIAGTCTDSPFFTSQGGISQFFSNDSFHSSKSFTSAKSISSVGSNNQGVFANSSIKGNNLTPCDIEDLLFINNWIGSIIPQISNQSTFFYVWLTKPQNFMKFLKQFRINVSIKNVQPFKRNTYNNNESAHQSQKASKLSPILQQLKQQGFQLNSLRVELLQKADQLEWLSFMWFFLSKAIVNPNYLKWLAKQLNYKQPSEITYSYVYKNYLQIITSLMTKHLDLKKQLNNNKAIDWKYIIQNFEPLLTHLKIIQSQRHLILSLNVMYHKINNVQKETIEISDFEFVLNVSNPYNRKVRYYLQCDPKRVVCEQSSNKVLPSKNGHGYSFMAIENQQINITFFLRNLSVHALTNISKNMVDLMDIIMFNNIIWDPITIFHIKLKRKQDIIHNVSIECENRSTQQWIYKFESKMSAEYRVFLELEPGTDPQSIRLLSGQPGLLKKGQTTTIRVVYNPLSMSKCQATLKIVNPMIKEVFIIEGKPMHSSKIQYERNLKIIQNQQHQQVFTLSWQNNISKPTTVNTSRALNFANIKAHDEVKNNQMRGIGSQSQRQLAIQKNVGTNKLKKTAQLENFFIRIYDSKKQNIEQINKYSQCIKKKQVVFNLSRKQIKIHLTFKFQKLLRNLQYIFQILDSNQTQSKLIRLGINVVPKPLLYKAQIETQFNTNVVENIKFPNLLKIPQSISLQYKYISAEADVKKFVNIASCTANNVLSELQNMNSMLSNIHKGLFDVLKTKNNDVISFNVPQSQKVLDFIQLSIRYSPNENNCAFKVLSQMNTGEASQKIEGLRSKANLGIPSINKNKKRNNQSSFSIPTNNEQTDGNKYSSLQQPQLPYFYITATYLQSLYQVTYLFKPTIRKICRKPHASIMLEVPKKDKQQQQQIQIGSLVHKDIKTTQNLVEKITQNTSVLQKIDKTESIVMKTKQVQQSRFKQIRDSKVRR